MEEDVGAQVEGVDGAVVADVPALGDVRDELQVLVEADEAGEDLDDVVRGLGVRGAGRVERDRVAAGQPQLALLPGGQCRRGCPPPPLSPPPPLESSRARPPITTISDDGDAGEYVDELRVSMRDPYYKNARGASVVAGARLQVRGFRLQILICLILRGDRSLRYDNLAPRRNLAGADILGGQRRLVIESGAANSKRAVSAKEALPQPRCFA